MKLYTIILVSILGAVLTANAATTVLDDNFDEFATGALNGQGAWTVDQAQIVVVTNVYYGNSGKSVSIPIAATTEGIFTQQTNTFEVSYKVRINKGAVSGTCKADFYVGDKPTIAVAIHVYDDTLTGDITILVGIRLLSQSLQTVGLIFVRS